MKNPWLLPLVCLFLASILLYCGSERVEQNQSTQVQTGPDGKTLAQGVCGSCHLVPAPGDLDKASWEQYILPRMGHFLGIYSDSFSRASLMEEGSAQTYLERENIYPKVRLIDDESWQKIKSYYLENAPEEMLTVRGYGIKKSSQQFKAIRPAFGLEPPSTTLVSYLAEEERFFLGDAFTSGLYVFDRQLRKLGQAKIDEAPVWLSKSDHHYYVTVMGSFSPTDAPLGKLVRLRTDGGGQTEVLVDSLQRPVHHDLADFDGDGQLDMVIAEFAKWTGSLSWWKASEHGFERRVLRNEPGAIKSFARDWDGDGDMDIVALFGQGNEGIWWYENDGEGQFTEQEIIRFPPSYGSSFMGLQDINDDGKLDIIYCAGDNADFPPVLKPYHGIRLFVQTVSGLEEKLFLELNGAYSAEVADFDADGDLDIASISFFPDYESHPEEGFVYYENQGDWTFNATSISEVGKGRWIVMDAGDPDKDGDTDLFLGSLAFEVPGREDLVAGWAQSEISFVLLENQSQ